MGCASSTPATSGPQSSNPSRGAEVVEEAEDPNSSKLSGLSLGDTTEGLSRRGSSKLGRTDSSSGRKREKAAQKTPKRTNSVKMRGKGRRGTHSRAKSQPLVPRQASNGSSSSEDMSGYRPNLMPIANDKDGGQAGGRGEVESSLHEFSAEEIMKATDGRKIKLGEGGFGVVYKGKMVVPGEGEVDVAVKVLKPESMQGFKEWQTEVNMLGQLQHDRLVKLYGYSGDGDECLLVYEYIMNRSFDYHLFSKSGPVVSWRRRMKVLLGAAEGIQYLHEGCGLNIIYRDFKTANILLDSDFNAKLSDFGLAREGPQDGKTHVSTDVVGTSGYLAPEYLNSGHARASCDIYGFGVVILEVLTGMRVSKYPEPKVSMVDWALAKGTGPEGVGSIMDPRLEGEWSEKAVRLVFAAAKMSVNDDPYARPTASKLVEALKVANQHTIKDALRRKQEQEQRQKAEAGAQANAPGEGEQGEQGEQGKQEQGN